MNITDYWPMVREYCHMECTAIASLQFWTADLDPVTLGRATEEVYSTFFYSTSTHTLHQQSDEILFGCFVIALNAAFDRQLWLADEGYESGSDTINLPTPLRKTCQEYTMFPAWYMLHLTQHLSHHEICHKLHPDQCTDDCHLAHPALQDAQKIKRRKRTSRGYL